MDWKGGQSQSFKPATRHGIFFKTFVSIREIRG
jgi:hypothetical protein